MTDAAACQEHSAGSHSCAPEVLDLISPSITGFSTHDFLKLLDYHQSAVAMTADVVEASQADIAYKHSRSMSAINKRPLMLCLKVIH